MTDLGKLNERKVHMLVSDIKCTNLPAMDSAVMGGVSAGNDSIFLLENVDSDEYFLHSKAVRPLRPVCVISEIHVVG
jgi:hypothetical protein